MSKRIRRNKNSKKKLNPNYPCGIYVVLEDFKTFWTKGMLLSISVNPNYNIPDTTGSDCQFIITHQSYSNPHYAGKEWLIKTILPITKYKGALT